MFGAVWAAEGTAREGLEAVAREFSPRVEPAGEREILLDLSGLTRLFGDAREIAEALRRTAADRGLRVRVAIAGTRTAARLLVRHRAGLTVIAPGTEAAALAPLPLALLDALDSTDPALRTAHPAPRTPHPAPRTPHPAPPTSTFRQWGLRTLGELAALPDDEVAARLGPAGVAWPRVARGEDARPLVAASIEERFEQAFDLEWPIEGLEPLSFVLGRLFEPLAAQLERRDRGAAALHVHLHLVTRAVHTRSLDLPAPTRDPRTLRTLALLDLESHPPAAAIDRVVVAVDPTPARVLQFSLLSRPHPTPDQIATLMARLTALMGEGRCGAPAPVDTWQPGAFTMHPFNPRDPATVTDRGPRRRGGGGNAGFKKLRCSAPPRPVEMNHAPAVSLRRFRARVPARVQVEGGRPVRMAVDRRGLPGGRVTQAAGPWRTSGDWWREGTWDRDEWDVALADGTTCRVSRERATDAWFLDGVLD